MSTRSRCQVPALIYGTAWKKERTRHLVRQALLTGFRGVDTAAQPKHYEEDLVGQGIADAMREAGLRRNELYIQTKYTSVMGQDPTKIPYDPHASIAEQVGTSVVSSLRNFADTAEPADEAYIDCLVLHSPFPSARQMEEAWRAMETHVPRAVCTLGISNVYHLPLLTALYDFATIKPTVVQNRFYRNTGYDRDIRAFCGEKGIVYQTFWTLSANPQLLRSELVESVAAKAGVSCPVALYGLVLSLGKLSVLDGTTSLEHMKEDLEGIQKVQSWSRAEIDQWADLQKGFDAVLAV